MARSVGWVGVIQRSTLREQLTDALREEVLAGRLAPGREFTVREIAESYGVSATPVREALLDLAAQGLLWAEQHRGFRVRPFDLADFQAMLEARELLGEGVLLRDPAAVRGPDPVAVPLATVRRRATAARQAAAAGDLDVHVGHDLGFWRELTALLSNPLIAEFLNRVRLHCWVFAVPRLRLEPDLAGTLWARHPELADAVARDDAPRTAGLLRDYWGHVRDHAVSLDERYRALGGDPTVGRNGVVGGSGWERSERGEW